MSKGLCSRNCEWFDGKNQQCLMRTINQELRQTNKLLNELADNTEALRYA